MQQTRNSRLRTFRKGKEKREKNISSDTQTISMERLSLLFLNDNKWILEAPKNSKNGIEIEDD